MLVYPSSCSVWHDPHCSLGPICNLTSLEYDHDLEVTVELGSMRDGILVSTPLMMSPSMLKHGELP